MKGMVLEGGAMRGMFTCGVIDVFMENGIDFDELQNKLRMFLFILFFLF